MSNPKDKHPSGPKDRSHQPTAQQGDSAGTPPESGAAQEWGQRNETGKTIARGGKTDGPVSGAEPDGK